MNSTILIRFAIVLQIIYAYLPILRAFPTPVRMGVRVMPFMLVLFAFLFLKDKNKWKVYLGVIVFALFLGFIRSMVYASGTEESILKNCLNSLLYWNCLIEGYFVVNHFKSNKAKRLLYFAFKIIAFTCLTSILFSLTNPGSIRSSTNFVEEEFAYYTFNVGTYSFIYSIVFLVPAIFFLLRHNKGEIIAFENTPLLILIVEILVVIVVSQFATALGLALIGVVICIFANMNYKVFKKRLVRNGLIFSGLFIVLIPFIGNLAQYVNQGGMLDLGERLTGIHQLFTGGLSAASGDVGARIFLYLLSIQHFFNNPIFGLWGEIGFSRVENYGTRDLLDSITTTTLGQHSALLDLLGGNGLVGFIPFCIVIFMYWKTIKKNAVTELSKECMFTVILLYFIYGFLDHAFSCFDVAFSVFVLSPMVIKVLPNLNKVKTQKRK